MWTRSSSVCPGDSRLSLSISQPSILASAADGAWDVSMDDLAPPVVTGPAGVIVGGGPVPAPVGTGRSTVATVAAKRSLIMIDASRSIPPLPALVPPSSGGMAFSYAEPPSKSMGGTAPDPADCAATGRRQAVVAEAPSDGR